MVVGARSMGAVGGNRGRRPFNKGGRGRERWLAIGRGPSLLISQSSPSGFSRAAAFGNSLRGLRSVSAFLPGRISAGPRSSDEVAALSADRLARRKEEVVSCTRAGNTIPITVEGSRRLVPSSTDEWRVTSLFLRRAPGYTPPHEHQKSGRRMGAVASWG